MTETTEPPPAPADVAAHRAAWLTALRSGDYPQAQGALRVDGGYCCLGVAEDVRGATWVAAADVTEAGEDHAGSHAVAYDDDDGGDACYEGAHLTRECRRWLGVVTGAPWVAARLPLRFEDDEGLRQLGVDRAEVDWDDPPVTWRVATLDVLNDDYRFTLAEVADVVADQPADWTGDQLAATADAIRRRSAEVATRTEGTDSP